MLRGEYSLQTTFFGKIFNLGLTQRSMDAQLGATIFNLGRFAVMQGIYRTELTLIASAMTGTAMGFGTSVITTTTTGTTTTMPTRAGTG